ncbi:MAG: hypothetical protein HKN26_02065 [Acidimicrobiales bacterium]|nr:hypothetical protein [Acidimicrobiales bacterium]
MRSKPALPGAHRHAVSYIDRSREYYAACGYEQPYRWATNADSPFAPLPKPLAQCRVGIITTSYPHHEDLAGSDDVEFFPLTTKAPYAQPVDPIPSRMFTDDLSWDKDATHTDDVATFLPIAQLAAAAAAGRIGSTAPRFFGAPTNYSQRQTNADAETIARWCDDDEVDVVVLVPL